MEAMFISQVSVFSLVSYILLLHHPMITVTYGPLAPDCLGDVPIGKSTALDGRQWITGSEGKSISSTAVDNSISGLVPYKPSRISLTPYDYTFLVNPGLALIRLYSYPASCRGFVEYKYVFTTKARDFNGSLAADASLLKYLVEEFCLIVEENRNLNMTLSHAPALSSNFKITIKYKTIPSDLYYMPYHDTRIACQNNRIHIHNITSLEILQRLDEEAFIWRRRGKRRRSYNRDRFQGDLVWIPNSFSGLLIRLNVGMKETDEFTFKIPVDPCFGYLLKLNFCEFVRGTIESGPKLFTVLIKNHISETLDGDYMVLIKGDIESSKCDLLTAVKSADELVIELNGLEIFKFKPHMILASPHSVFPEGNFRFWTPKIKRLRGAFGLRNATATILTILGTLLNVIVYKLRQVWNKNINEEKDRQSASTEPCYRYFSLAEIMSATQNFSDAFVIGKGGFGKVYKGFIHGNSEIVAIKRLTSNSKQGAHEFWTEIETLSKLRHIHLVSLLGYCKECQEMILVYEYMPRGTLADNLYKIGRDKIDVVPLCWEKRLKICIGAARGLDYLHTGTQYGVIHRDVKDSNILLDENFVAKISDFGLSKLEMISESKSYVSTKVKGTFGYLDPEYFMTRKLTRKTDVYAFGVVLLVVLCGRPAVDNKVPGDWKSLLLCFRECIRKGDIGEIIDPCLHGKISSDSLKIFVESIEGCLLHQPKKRPTMAQVVARLEDALEQQESATNLVSEPWEPVPIHPFQYNQGELMHSVHEESVVSLPKKRTKDVFIQDSDLSTRGKALSQREMGCTSVRKPSLILQPVAPWNRGKSVKKKFLFSPDGPCFHFSINEIREATDNCRVDNIIIEDELRIVYVGFVQHMQRDVCFCLFKTRVQIEEILRFRDEIEKLSQLRHPNLLSLIGYCYHENQIFIAYDYVGKSTLHNNLYGTEKENHLSWKRRLQICIGVAQGLDYLHGHEILHMDVKPTIILLDENCVPKVSNFGLYKVSPKCLFSETKTSNQVPQIFEYMSPEDTIPGWKSSEKSDVYSFGLILLEILCCRRPLNCSPNLKHDEKHLEYWVKRNIRSKTLSQIVGSKLKGQIAGACLAEFLKIAFSCLHVQAIQRPSMADVVEKLKLALELQEVAEAARQNTKGKGKLYIKGKGKNSFKLKDIYPEIFHLAA